MHAMLSYESNKKGKLSPGEPSAETFLRALGIFVLCMLLLQLLLPERLQPLLYMVLLAVPAFTLTGLGCRFLTAYRLFYRRREEFVEFEQMVYDEDAFTMMRISKSGLPYGIQQPR